MKIALPDRFKKEFFDKKQNMVIVTAILLGIFILTSKFILPSEEKTSNETFSADTIIPLGYVLVPIELVNLQSTSALIGQYGIVDLFLPSEKTTKVASQVKMIRAPLNPNLFAVLVQEKQAQLILKAAGPFIAVVQNPDQNSQTIIEQKKVSKSRIQYQEGGI